MSYWLTDVRKTALLAAIFTALTGLQVLWNIARSVWVLATSHNTSAPLTAVATLPLSFAQPILLTLFYFLLSQDRTPLRISSLLRGLCVASALFAAWNLLPMIAFSMNRLGLSYVLASAGIDWTVGGSSFPAAAGYLNTSASVRSRVPLSLDHWCGSRDGYCSASH